MQDASAQTALLQFAVCGASSAAVPASVHCDHLISAFEGAEADLKRSIVSSKEVYDFLESAARKFVRSGLTDGGLTVPGHRLLPARRGHCPSVCPRELLGAWTAHARHRRACSAFGVH